MAEALRRGDELHNRNAAATSMLAEQLARGFTRAGVAAALQERAFELMAANPQFFVPCSLAVVAAGADRGRGHRRLEPRHGRAARTAASAASRSRGCRAAGSRPRPRCRPASSFQGSRQKTPGPAAATRCWSSASGSGRRCSRPRRRSGRCWASTRRAHADLETTREDRARRAPALPRPRARRPAALPSVSTSRRVVETGIRPVIDIVMVHPERGRGMVGFGLTSPPLACFEQAVEALANAG